MNSFIVTAYKHISLAVAQVAPGTPNFKLGTVFNPVAGDYVD